MLVMTNDIGHLFFLIGHSYIFFVKCLLKSFAQLLIDLIFLMTYEFFIRNRICEYVPPFSQSVTHFLKNFLKGTLERKSLHFDEVELIDFFPGMDHALGVIYKRSLPNLLSRGLFCHISF